MNPAHLHLALTHVPVIGIVLGLLLLAFATYTQKMEVVRVSLGVFVLTGLVALLVYFTGEAAEEIIESTRTVSEALIESHEEAGFIAMLCAAGLGILALVGLLVSKKDVPRWVPVVMLVAALLTSGVMAWTANLGGQISHPEIRAATLAEQPTTQSPSSAHEQHEDEND